MNSEFLPISMVFLFNNFNAFEKSFPSLLSVQITEALSIGSIFLKRLNFTLE